MASQHLAADHPALIPFARPRAPGRGQRVRRLIGARLRESGQFNRRMSRRRYPIRGYHGIFVSDGCPPRWDARCLQCRSRERHRLTHLRVTQGRGLAALSVPINASRRHTYENPSTTDPFDRAPRFSAPDRKRRYGLDFVARLECAGFSTEIFGLPPDREVRYGLLRDEWIAIARKPG